MEFSTIQEYTITKSTIYIKYNKLINNLKNRDFNNKVSKYMIQFVFVMQYMLVSGMQTHHV